mmetsp:Transcript_37484/g.57411  ORF Transcript_37484/g.57411 Transcript_37484/m.57411 type:complete len:143 (+) Transcript_37484:29-457(+)
MSMREKSYGFKPPVIDEGIKMPDLPDFGDEFGDDVFADPFESSKLPSLEPKLPPKADNPEEAKKPESGVKPSLKNMRLDEDNLEFIDPFADFQPPADGLPPLESGPPVLKQNFLSPSKPDSKPSDAEVSLAEASKDKIPSST